MVSLLYLHTIQWYLPPSFVKISLIDSSYISACVSSEAIPWDNYSIFTLLSNLTFNKNYSSQDAAGLETALDLLSKSSSRGPKKVFVFTDGYGTSGLNLTRALQRAEAESIDVVGVGVGFDRTFVACCYQKFVIAALPHALPDALRMLYEQEPNADDHSADFTDDMVASRVDGGDQSVEEILNRTPPNAFPQLKEMLRAERRHAKIEEGSQPGNLSADICFVLDVTGSMSAWLDAAKQQIESIMAGVEVEIKKQYGQLKIEFRFGALVYRDVGDSGHLDACRFCKPYFVFRFDAYLFRDYANGYCSAVVCVVLLPCQCLRYYLH